VKVVPQSIGWTSPNKKKRPGQTQIFALIRIIDNTATIKKGLKDIEIHNNNNEKKNHDNSSSVTTKGRWSNTNTSFVQASTSSFAFGSGSRHSHLSPK